MAAAPGVQLDKLAKPYLRLDSYRCEFETFKKARLEYAPRLCNQDEGNLRDKLWKSVDRDVREALELKLGAEQISQISLTQLMLEISSVTL